MTYKYHYGVQWRVQNWSEGGGLGGGGGGGGPVGVGGQWRHLAEDVNTVVHIDFIQQCRL